MVIEALRATAKAAEPENHVEDIDYAPEAYLDGFRDAIAVVSGIADELESKDAWSMHVYRRSDGPGQPKS